MKGFTLFEIILTIGIFAILVAVTAPLAFRFLGTQNIDDATKTTVASLRQARTQALFQKNDASFGINFSSSSYTLFQGSSYATRTATQDIVTTFPVGITISGLTEVVFEKRTGTPSSIGTLLIQSGGSSRSITINSQGLIQ